MRRREKSGPYAPPGRKGAIVSYIIEYNRLVFVDESPGCDRSDTHHLLLIRQGGSNCYDVKGNRARDWKLLAFGTEDSLWPVIGQRAGRAEGGNIQRAKGWRGTARIKVEEYVSLYRQAIAKARPLAKIMDMFDITVVIDISIKANSFYQERLEKTIKEYAFVDTWKVYGSYRIYSKKITSMEMLGGLLESWGFEMAQANGANDNGFRVTLDLESREPRILKRAN